MNEVVIVLIIIKSIRSISKKIKKNMKKTVEGTIRELTNMKGMTKDANLLILNAFMREALRDKILIGNCSGFYGDRLSAAKDMVEGGPIDVLTGDYLAELTMTILYNQKMKRGEDQGYVGTFLKQFKDVAKSCQERNIKIVTNAGGLNPSSMANKVEEITQELNLDLKIAYIDGDDLIYTATASNSAASISVIDNIVEEIVAYSLKFNEATLVGEVNKG